MVYMVSQTAAVAMFTLTRLFYSSVLGYIALILFNTLPGGSAARFWYEQPNLVSKITSLFDPFGPTGKRGIKTTNAIAMICTLLALALNILPTLLSKMSPISIQANIYETNSTLSPVSNIFIPTLTDINLPGLSDMLTSRNATNKFLCTYLRDGCMDSHSTPIAQINWDPVELEPIAFYHSDSDTPNDLTVNINEAFGTTQQYMFIARQVFNSTSPFSGNYSIGQWRNNSLSGFYMTSSAAAIVPFDFLHADQIFPLVTPDLADMLRQGKGKNMYMPTDGGVDRAERWVAVHRNLTLSSLLWQTVNAHQGTIGAEWETSCFFCSLLEISPGSAQATSMQENLILSSETNNTQTFVVHSYVDNLVRLSTTLCLIQFHPTTGGLSYYCSHTYSQIWSVLHTRNPYEIISNYDVQSIEDLATNGSPFPLFPPPQLSNNRTYFPIVPVFQIRSKGQCSASWNFQTQTIQSWINDCAQGSLGQVDTTSINTIATNIWQLSSTITVGGFLVNATYYQNDIGILIGIPVIVIVFASVFLCIVLFFVTSFVTSPIHRRSLYETVRVVPSSSDPYNVQNMVLDIYPTNTLRLVDSIYDKKVAYLKLNNRLIVAQSEDHEISTDDNSSMDVNMSPNEIQKWSRQKLLNF